MRKIDLLNRKVVRIINDFENQLLDVIDRQDDFTRSDLQGRVGAIVVNILRTKLPIE